jgi:dephospho-CoA kinase
VILVGLTGGIGAGKSTVARMFEQLGAVVVDADLIVRKLQEPGEPVYQAIVDSFGEEILLPDRTINRPALAQIVFSDPARLEQLNNLVHPAVREEIARQVAHSTSDVVILDVPLIAESHGREGMKFVVTVEAPDEVRVQRLVSTRGMSEADARARIAAQATRGEREAIADRVIENHADLDSLAAQVRAVWTELAAAV